MKGRFVLSIITTILEDAAIAAVVLWAYPGGTFGFPYGDDYHHACLAAYSISPTGRVAVL